MPDSDKDDLHHALARMADGVEPEVAEQSDQPLDLPQDEADCPVASSISDSGEGEASAPCKPQPSASAPGAVKAAFSIVLLIVGGLLLAWTVYGVLILTGAVVVDRDDAQSMAGLMVFAGGPLGLILVTAGTIGLRNWFKARAEAN